jgi:ABC-type microcin C transport system duplicated ATPase subunit YejF
MTARRDPTDTAGSAVLVQKVSVRFPVSPSIRPSHRSYLTAVDDVTLTIARGESLGLVGESGSGKTTLGQAILRLVRSTGRIELFGEDVSAASAGALRRLRRQMQVVFRIRTRPWIHDNASATSCRNR